MTAKKVPPKVMISDNDITVYSNDIPEMAIIALAEAVIANAEAIKSLARTLERVPSYGIYVQTP